jgi:hypothetical protein
MRKSRNNGSPGAQPLFWSLLILIFYLPGLAFYNNMAVGNYWVYKETEWDEYGQVSGYNYTKEAVVDTAQRDDGRKVFVYACIFNPAGYSPGGVEDTILEYYYYDKDSNAVQTNRSAPYREDTIRVKMEDCVVGQRWEKIETYGIDAYIHIHEVVAVGQTVVTAAGSFDGCAAIRYIYGDQGNPGFRDTFRIYLHAAGVIKWEIYSTGETYAELIDYHMENPDGLERSGALSVHETALSIGPNPFNTATVVRVDLAASDYVSLTVFDAAGREVGTLIKGVMRPGRYRAGFDGSAMPSGHYFFMLSAGGRTLVRPGLLVK